MFRECDYLFLLIIYLRSMIYKLLVDTLSRYVCVKHVAERGGFVRGYCTNGTFLFR